MDEKKLIAEAETGNVESMLTLAKYYAKQAKIGGIDDNVGDVISTEDFFKSLAAEDKKDTSFEEKAYKYFRMAADAGNVAAMAEVGRRLYDGIGVEKNNEESQIYYRRAAESGNPSAMRVVACTSDDDAEKFKYYRLSAELLEPGLNKQDSIKQTAINYALGRGTEQDFKAAKMWTSKLKADDAAEVMMQIADKTNDDSWLERAANISGYAAMKLADKMIEENDFVSGLNWYKKAVEKLSKGSIPPFLDKCANAMSMIGDLYYVGEGEIPQDDTEAIKWYSKAAGRNYNMGKIKYALMFYRGRGIEQDLRTAFEMFEKISWSREKFLGPFRFNSVARYYTAKMKENGEGCEKVLDEELERYKLSVGKRKIADYETPRNFSPALYKIAESYFLGRGVKQNFSKALKYYEQAFESYEWTTHKLEAAKKIMWMYELGEGIPQDKVKTEEWRKKVNELLEKERA